jgi:hypothetical protein
MRITVACLLCIAQSVTATKLDRTVNRASIEQASSTFQDDEEFEMFYDVLREISQEGGDTAGAGDEEQDQDLTTTTTTVEPEQQGEEEESTVMMMGELGGGAELLEDSVDEVIADYEGGLVEIIRQVEDGGDRRGLVGVAVGAGVGGLLLTLCGLAALYMWMRRKHSHTKRSDKESKRANCDFEPVPTDV